MGTSFWIGLGLGLFAGANLGILALALVTVGVQHPRVRETYVGGPWDGDIRAPEVAPPQRVMGITGGVYVRDAQAHAYLWQPSA